VTGCWQTPRADPHNLGRGELTGGFTGPPTETWRLATGADIHIARTVAHPTGPAVLVHAGSTLQLFSWDGGQLWANLRLGARRVIHVGPPSLDGGTVALVAIDNRTVVLIDLRQGRVVWTWQAEPSSDLTSPGASKVWTGSDGTLRWTCFPTYSTRGVCVDLAASPSPRILWETDFSGRYDTGFGPNVIVADVLSDGVPQVILSSRTGDQYPRDERGEITGAELVLGRTDGQIYQAIVNGDTGELLMEGSYRPDDGAYPCARPYGLFEAVRQPDRTELVLVSCQVEEYLAVTRIDTEGLNRRWGAFIERDWPTDRLELRPQVSSLADLAGTGQRALTVGLWDGSCWSTLVVDPDAGLHGDASRRVADRYFWGCHDIDGDGRPDVLVSEEHRRVPGRRGRLEVLDGMTLVAKAVLEDAAFVLSSDSELPSHRNFLADRNNPVAVSDGAGTTGVLVVSDRDGEERVSRWSIGSDGASELHDLAAGRFRRADWDGHELILSDSTGRLLRFDPGWACIASVGGVLGRFCQPLAWRRQDGHEIVVDLAGDRVAGGRVNEQSHILTGRWDVDGSLPALDSSGGACRLAVAHTDDPHHPTVTVHTEPGRPQRRSVTTELIAPPFAALVPTGPPYRLIANLRTGVHTAALTVLDEAGNVVWTQANFGGHPRPPGIGATPNGPFLAADDHGVLRVLGLESGRVIAESDWTAAYTVPICVPGSDGATALILRADGVHGIEALDTAGRRLWRRETDLWRYFPGWSAVARLGGRGPWLLGSVSRDGVLDATDVATGRLRWQMPIGPVDAARAVAAGDVDGDGRDEFLVGTSDGRLVCVAETAPGEGRILWEHDFGVSVANPVIADVDGDGSTEILVATADGFVRMLRPACGQ
jgi:outer membrane protein assembly factor BamB